MDIALLVLVALAAFTVEANLGFGSLIIAVALGSLLLPIEELLPALLPLNLVLSAHIVVRHRRELELRWLLRRVLPLMVAGLPVGMLLLHTSDERLLKALLGVFVVALSAAELRRARGGAPVGGRPLAPLARTGLLVAAGIVHGAFATGGPLAVYVAGRSGLHKGAFRATLSALWLGLNTALLGSFALAGTLSAESARRTLLLAGPLLLGLALGERLHRRVDATLFRRLVFVLLLLAGAALAVDALVT